MGGIAELTRRMAILRGETERTKESLGELPAVATDAVDGVADGLREVTTEAAQAHRSLQGFRAGGTATGLARTGGTGAAPAASGDRTFTQQEIIEQIRNTTAVANGAQFDVGAVLDRYIELYTDMLVRGAAQTLTPQRQAMIERALYARNIGARDLIQNFAGAAGRKINFSQLEADIKRMLRMQQDAERAIRQGRGVTPTGSTSGTLGRQPTQTCGPTSSLDLLLKSGALR